MPILANKVSSRIIRKAFKTGLHTVDAVKLVWTCASGWLVAGTILLMIQGMLPLLSLYLTKLLVDTLTDGLDSLSAEIVFKDVIPIVLMMGATTIATTLFASLSNITSEIQGEKVSERVHSMIHAKSVEIDLEFYENSFYFDTYFRAQQEAPYRPTLIVNGLAQLCRSSISLIAISALLFTFHWIVAVILFIAIFPGILVRMKYSEKMYHWQQTRSQLERQADYYHWILTGDAFAKEIRLFDFSSLFMDRFLNIRKVLRKEKFGISLRRTFLELAYHTASVIAIFGCLGFIIFRVVNGSITLGDMVMYYQALLRCQSALRDVLGNIAGLYEHSLFLSHVDAFMSLTPKIRPPANPIPFPETIKDGITLENISFRYPGSQRDVFTNLNLSIRAGEHMALVGENGEGKTTLIKLLCRLYDPVSGKITIDGTDIRCFDPAGLRRKLTVIFQDYVKYHLTVKENIRLGNIEEKDDQRIEHAAKRSGADSMIRRLPHGYDTLLGKWFDEGEELSIGEWQKIALARAFMRDPQIIILDEPTSALDPQAEFNVLKQFRKIAEGKTAVFISHRLSSARLADRICVMKNGKIVEDGTHDELLTRKGLYARLFELQTQTIIIPAV